MPKASPVEDRFWAKVDKHGPKQPHMKTRCWVWTGATNGRYPTFCYNGTREYAHRFSLRVLGNTDIDGLEACHQCDTPLCIRPEHLFAGGHSDNMKDCSNKGRLGGFAGDPTLRPRGRQHWAYKDATRISGEQHYDSRLTERDVLDIIEIDFARTGTLKRVAGVYGVSSTAIRKILSRKSWKSVTRNKVIASEIV